MQSCIYNSVYNVVELLINEGTVNRGYFATLVT